MLPRRNMTSEFQRYCVARRPRSVADVLRAHRSRLPAAPRCRQLFRRVQTVVRTRLTGSQSVNFQHERGSHLALEPPMSTTSELDRDIAELKTKARDYDARHRVIENCMWPDGAQ